MWWKRLLQCDSKSVSDSGSDSGSGSRKTSRSTSSKLVLGTSGLVGVASAVSW